jgi:serine protease Do
MRKNILWPILLSIIVVVSTILIIVYFYPQWSKRTMAVDNEVANLVKSDAAEKELDLKTIIHESQKTVVQIEAEKENGQSIGSGFIYNDKGDILTNAHVVNNANSIYVKTSDAKTYPGALIGINEEQDIAVIRVPQLVNKSHLEVDPDFEAEVGDAIIAVGSPLGFQNTVSTGIISGKNRTLTVDSGFEYKNVYQISAPITNGNSGGPLIHQQTGKIIAINSAGMKEGVIGFSIPLNKVMDMAEMWSRQADNKELNFSGDIIVDKEIDTEQLQEDANYIVKYFYENLKVRDYLTAYTMLGSQIQEQTTYQDFRNRYIHIINISTSNIQSELKENNRVLISMITDNHIRTNNQQELIEKYEVTFTIGYENDQLKIINQTEKLLSSTNLMLDNE